MLFLETEQFNSEIFSIVEIFSAQEVIEFTKKAQKVSQNGQQP